MSRILFDLEGNGFLPEVSRIHCVACVDVDTEERRVFGPHQIQEALDYLAGNTLIAHNGLGYDFPVLEKLYGFVVPPERQLDTLVIARLMHPNVRDRDSDMNAKRLVTGETLMGDQFGKHTLKAWGIRLRLHKAAFEGPWDGWTQEMQDYCVQDVETNLKLWRYLNYDNYSQIALELEHDVARLCRMISDIGWPFDEQAAGLLHGELVGKQAVVETRLIEEFKGWEEATVFTPKVNNKKLGYVKGVPFTKKKFLAFKPTSRQHMIRALKDRGWTPSEFTDSGQAKFDEDVIESLASTFTGCDDLVEFLMLDKRIGQLATGKQAWLVHVKNGRIHAEYNPMGAVTSRASHFNPNIAQVPASSSQYGRECRALFIVLKGWKMLGADMSGLEGRCLAHYLAKYDDGEYGRVLLNGGDVHWDVVLEMGFFPKGTERDKHDELHTLVRETGAKRCFYAMMYGSGDKKTGKIILDCCRAARKLDPVRGGALYTHFFGEHNDAPRDRDLKAVGKIAKAGVLDGIFGLKKLKQTIASSLEERSTLPGLDKRRLPVRSEHSALNLMLQSAGAILCKRWIVDAYKALIAAGYKWGVDFYFLGWIHDELQIAVRDGLEEAVGTIVVHAAREAGKPYGFRIPLDSQYKVGASWADTH